MVGGKNKRRTDRGPEDPPSTIFTIIGVVIIFGVVVVLGFMRMDTGTPSSMEGSAQEQANSSLPSSARKGVVVKNRSGAESTNNSISAPEENHVNPVISGFPLDPINQRGLHIQISFGRDAVERCLPICANDTACEVDCKRLMAVEFARRILPADPDPAKLAADAVQSCDELSLPRPLEPHESAEVRRLLEPPSIFDREQIAGRIRMGAKLFSRLVKGGKPDAESKALCLLEGILTAELAISEAATLSDSYSEMFYRKFEERLLKELPTVARELGKV